MAYRIKLYDRDRNGKIDLKKIYFICDGKESLIVEKDIFEGTAKVDSSYWRYGGEAFDKRFRIEIKNSYAYDECGIIN